MKKTLRKWMVILIAGLMIFSLTGCQESTETLPVEQEGDTDSADTGSDDTSSGTESTTSQTASQSVTSTESTQAGSSETTPEQTEAPVEQPDQIRIAAGEITGCFNGLFATREGDKAVAQLIMPSMLVTDRQGMLVYDAGEGGTGSAPDERYEGVVSLAEEFDEEANTTTYTITVRNGAKYSDGTPITADDIIFTYYVLCDPSYDGPSKVQYQNIYGVRAYQLNNTAAPGIEVTDGDVNDALANPPDGLRQAVIDQVIRPTLEEERAWCEANWERYVDRGYGDNARELFVTLYTSAMSSGYSADDKSFDQIVNDTVELFGMNYKTLAKNYKNDIDFFNETVRTITRNYLYETRLERAGGEEMPRISGITRQDERTVAIKILGPSSTAIRTICDVPILSLHYYGKDDLYNYDQDHFGLERGNLEGIRAKDSEPFGYGPFQFVSVDGTTATLANNSNYYGEEMKSTVLTMVWSDNTDKLSLLTSGRVDLADLELSDTEIGAVRDTNDNGLLNGEALRTLTYNDDTYYYLGMNSTRVNVNDGELTEASLHLRRAIAMVVSTVREEVCFKYYGETARLIDYPCSSSFYALSGVTPDVVPLDHALDGTALTKETVMNAVREELSDAGYVFREEGTISRLPEGGKLKFTVHVPPYLAGDNAVSATLAEAKTMLESIGFEIGFKEYTDVNEFVVALSNGKADMWIARRDASAVLSPASYYSSGGNNNYYRLHDTELTELIKSLGGTEELTERAAIYREVFAKIIEDVIEVPIYQKQRGIVYNAEKLYIDPYTQLTEYYSVLNELSVVKMLENVPEEERIMETTTAEEITPEPSSPAETTPEDSEEESSVEESEEETDASDDVASTSEPETEEDTKETTKSH